MKQIWIINGPNLNFLGIREPEIYGNETLHDLEDYLRKNKDIQFRFLQSNHEGQLVDWIQEAYFNKVDGIVLNPAAYTHTSIALADAIEAIRPIPVVEVHLSNIQERENFRKVSLVKAHCLAQIQGKGFQSYQEAIELLISGISNG